MEIIMNLKKAALCSGLCLSLLGCEALPISIVSVNQSTQIKDASSLSGVWQGSYTCGQGLTGLTVKLQGNHNGEVTGLFEFYPLPQNPNIPVGAFTVSGKYFTNNQIILSPLNWVKKPQSYTLVSLNGKATSTHFNGVIPECGNNSFNLIHKSN